MNGGLGGGLTRPSASMRVRACVCMPALTCARQVLDSDGSGEISFHELCSELKKLV